jgi:cyclopropane-fatty-acyl-phospholipid synthase
MYSQDCSIYAQPNGGAFPLRALACAALRRILRDLAYGQLVVDTPCGRLVHDSGRPGPQARLGLHSWRALWRLLAGGNIGFAQAYIEREWSSPDLVALLDLACRNVAVSSRTPLAPLQAFRRAQHALSRNTRRGSRRNIAAHYDLGNEFFAYWLDEDMTYSSAIFSSPGQTLEAAQHAKLDCVIDRLDLSPGHNVLEIGCGWGSLAERMIRRRGCKVTGLTLSIEQLAYAHNRLSTAGLSYLADLRLQDYRDLAGSFDRIVSIEMLEAVGEAYWPVFFSKLAACLRPQGVAVIQAITIDERYSEDYRRNPDFIQRSIFPGGMLPTRSAVCEQVSRAGLELQGIDSFGASYALTLAAWRERFQRRWPEIEARGFDLRFKRMWEYYLAYCEAGFRAGTLDVGIYRIVNCADYSNDGSCAGPPGGPEGRQ